LTAWSRSQSSSRRTGLGNATITNNLDTLREIVRILLDVQDVRKKDTNTAIQGQQDVPIVKATIWQPTNHAQNRGNNRSDLSIYASMNSTINILQANLGKTSGAQDASYNDQELREFDLILMQEPHYCNFDSNTHITGMGANFEAIKPKITMLGNQDSRIRSCIWAHRNNEYIQIPTDNNDTTMIILQKANRNILVASVYIPCNTLTQKKTNTNLWVVCRKSRELSIEKRPQTLS
jgi:hypothetical protein